VVLKSGSASFGRKKIGRKTFCRHSIECSQCINQLMVKTDRVIAALIKHCVSQMTVGKMSFSHMPVGQMPFAQIPFCQNICRPNNYLLKNVKPLIIIILNLYQILANMEKNLGCVFNCRCTSALFQ
jgi:hypothetical protein